MRHATCAHFSNHSTMQLIILHFWTSAKDRTHQLHHRLQFPVYSSSSSFSFGDREKCNFIHEDRVLIKRPNDPLTNYLSVVVSLCLFVSFLHLLHPQLEAEHSLYKIDHNASQGAAANLSALHLLHDIGANFG